MFVWSENGTNKTKDILGARMKIMWEEQLADTPIPFYLLFKFNVPEDASTMKWN